VVFKIGDRVGRNWWVDRRDSGWHHGTIKSEAVFCFGIVAYRVYWDSGYESLAADGNLELITDEK